MQPATQAYCTGPVNGVDSAAQGVTVLVFDQAEVDTNRISSALLAGHSQNQCMPRMYASTTP